MDHLLPHVAINLEPDNCVSVSAETYAVFDYLDDYLAVENGIDWEDRFTSENDQGYAVYTMYFNEKYTCEFLRELLLKLPAGEIERLFRESDGR